MSKLTSGIANTSNTNQVRKRRASDPVRRAEATNEVSTTLDVAETRRLMMPLASSAKVPSPPLPSQHATIVFKTSTDCAPVPRDLLSSLSEHYEKMLGNAMREACIGEVVDMSAHPPSVPRMIIDAAQDPGMALEMPIFLESIFVKKDTLEGHRARMAVVVQIRGIPLYFNTLDTTDKIAAFSTTVSMLSGEIYRHESHRKPLLEAHYDIAAKICDEIERGEDHDFLDALQKNVNADYIFELVKTPAFAVRETSATHEHVGDEETKSRVSEMLQTWAQEAPDTKTAAGVIALHARILLEAPNNKQFVPARCDLARKILCSDLPEADKELSILDDVRLAGLLADAHSNFAIPGEFMDSLLVAGNVTIERCVSLFGTSFKEKSREFEGVRGALAGAIVGGAVPGGGALLSADAVVPQVVIEAGRDTAVAARVSRDLPGHPGGIEPSHVDALEAAMIAAIECYSDLAHKHLGAKGPPGFFDQETFALAKSVGEFLQKCSRETRSAVYKSAAGRMPSKLQRVLLCDLVRNDHLDVALYQDLGVAVFTKLVHEILHFTGFNKEPGFKHLPSFLGPRDCYAIYRAAAPLRNPDLIEFALESLSTEVRKCSAETQADWLLHIDAHAPEIYPRFAKKVEPLEVVFDLVKDVGQEAIFGDESNAAKLLKGKIFRLSPTELELDMRYRGVYEARINKAHHALADWMKHAYKGQSTYMDRSRLQDAMRVLKLAMPENLIARIEAIARNKNR